MEKYTSPPKRSARFGLSQFAKHPPKWVLPALSISVILITTLSEVVQGDPGISLEVRERVGHYADYFVRALCAIAPFFGVTLKR